MNDSPWGAALFWREWDVTAIPLIYRSKRARVKWRRWVGRLPPKALQRGWFRGLVNVGLLVDGFVVLDFDSEKMYKRWTADKPLREGWTYTVRTARGYHIYVRLEEKVRSSQFSLQTDPDIICGEIKANGYVLVPPSVHPNGAPYIAQCNPAFTYVVNLEELGIVKIESRDPYMPGNGYAGTYSTSNGVVGRIKAEINIAAYLARITTLEMQGDMVVGLCPFHDDHHPSLQIHPADGWCYCHSNVCPAHKRCDVIDIAAMLWEVDTSHAVTILAQEL